MTSEALVQKLLHYDKDDPDSLRDIKDVLKEGADPNVIFSEDGVCAMLLAAGLGADVLSLLLEHHGDPNAQSLDGTTPLHVAASWGDCATLELLLCSGASADLQDQDGKTALDLALENENEACLEELKRHAMLAAYEDISLTPKFTSTFHDDVSPRTIYFPPFPVDKAIERDEDNTCEGRKAKRWDLDKSFIEPELLSSAYSNTVTQRVYDCLEQGKRVCLDATSPTTPIVTVKPTSVTLSGHCTPRIPSPLCCASSSTARITGHRNPELEHCSHSHHNPQCHLSHCANFYEPCCSGDHGPAYNCSRTSPCCSHHPPANQCCHSSSPFTWNFHPSHPCSSSFNESNKFYHRLRCHEQDWYLSKVENRSEPPYSRRRSRSQDDQLRGPSFSTGKNHTEFSAGVNGNGSGDYRSSINGISRRISDVKINENRSPIAGLESDMKSARTANFVLSCPDILSQIDFEQKSDPQGISFNKPKTNSQVDKTSLCSNLINDEKKAMIRDRKFFSNADETKNNMKAASEEKNQRPAVESETAPSTPEKGFFNSSASSSSSSSSSCDSFSTCQSAFDENNPKENVAACLSKSKDKSKSSYEYGSKSNRRWQPPLINVVDDDLMTSDDSFIQREAQKTRHVEARGQKNHSLPPMRQDSPRISQNSSRNQCSQMSPDRGKTNHSLSPVHQVPPHISQNSNQKQRDQASPGKDTITGERARLSDESLFSSISVKEYVYNDKERGITLIERFIPSDCGNSVGRRSLDSVSSKVSLDSKVSLSSQGTLIYDWRNVKPAVPVSLNDTLTISSDDQSQTLTLEIETDSEDQVTIPPWIESLTNEKVTTELQKYGEMPGPVVAATRQVYLRRLASLESNPGLVKLSKTCPDFPCELRKALDGLCDWNLDLADLEAEMANSFTVTLGRQWREGTAKSSFTYLLLDPRVTDNLPFRATRELSEAEAFKTFICSIFYIGKGKRARPYCHLYEAVAKLKETDAKRSAKVQHIIDIWEDGRGVVSLHCFQSVIPVEAYTREACMLEAIGMHKVTNVKRGDFYGIACSWSMQRRRQLGVYLLKKAFAIFVAEGERQIYIPDLK